MISHEHKCIFIHIPKCAGTSIERALGHFDSHQGRRGQDHRTIRMLEPLAPASILRDRRNHLELLRRIRHRVRRNANAKNAIRVSRGQYDEYFKFTVVRDPWSRAVSVYRNVMKDATHRKVHRVTPDTSFREFLHAHIGRGMLRPQLDWIVDWRGGIPLDFIGRFENLAEDFRRITEVLGPLDLAFEPARPLVLAEWFDDELDGLVRRTYAEEIDRLEFRPPLAERARASSHGP